MFVSDVAEGYSTALPLSVIEALMDKSLFPNRFFIKYISSSHVSKVKKDWPSELGGVMVVEVDVEPEPLLEYLLKM